MEVAISLPDQIAQHLQEKHTDVPRDILESIALEGYRSRTLMLAEVRQLLGLEDRFAVHHFLAAHDVPLYTVEDLRHDLATLDRMQAP